MKTRPTSSILTSIAGDAVKTILVAIALLAGTPNAIRATDFVYSCTATGAVDFSAFVTLDYNHGYVTTRPVITIETAAPMGAGVYYFAGGTVTPLTITHTGFELDYLQNNDGSQGFQDEGLVFDELLQVPEWRIVTSVPEPATWRLGLVALAGLLICHRAALKWPMKLNFRRSVASRAVVFARPREDEHTRSG